MVAGFLGAEAPKRREKDRLGRGEGKEKLLRTVVPFLPHKSILTLQFIARLKPAVRQDNPFRPSIITHSEGHIHLVDWGKKTASVASRLLPERDATLVPSETRPLCRAERDHCAERDATLVPSGTRPLSRADRAPLIRPYRDP